jgi:single stranded DNA-binding protein
VKLRIVSSKKKRDGTGEDEQTTFINVTAWRQLAENIVESVSKGDLVDITGDLTQRDWEDSDGNRRTTYEIQAYSVSPSLAFATAKMTRIQRERREERRVRHLARGPGRVGGALPRARGRGLEGGALRRRGRPRRRGAAGGL